MRFTVEDGREPLHGDTAYGWCFTPVFPGVSLGGFQIVSEKFYTVDDFNTHRTKFNKMVIVRYLANS